MYKPPYIITPVIIDLIERIGERLGIISGLPDSAASPQLRRGNRIRTVQASLEIEGNTLSLEQVTAVLEDKKVWGNPREIQEVRNALNAYEAMTDMNFNSIDDLLKAHELMMYGLVDNPGAFRQGNVGIQRGDEILHVAPPADRVYGLITELLTWLNSTDEHPLVKSCVFHYELEFIHPFMDGNGRLGRLWQTLILGKWKPLFFLLPIESVVRDRQADYYSALRDADKTAEATLFVEFMLDAILKTFDDFQINKSDQVGDQVSDQVKKLLTVITEHAVGAVELMGKLGLSHRPTFRKNYLHPALEYGFIEMSIPDKPQSRNQKYRLTELGINCKRSK